MRNFLSKLNQAKGKVFAIILSIIVIALVIVFAIFSIKGRKLNEAEQVALNQLNDKVLPYIDEFKIGDEAYMLTMEEKFVCFATLYSYEENDKTELTPKEINDIIHDYFDTDIDLKDILSRPMNPSLSEKGIMYSSDENKIIYTPAKRTKKEIAQTPVTSYIQKEAKIKGKTITSTYSKYVAEDPYNVFSNAALRGMDTTGIGAYLDGEGKTKSIKRLITPENADEIAIQESDLELTIIVKNGKLLIQL